jgi:thiamine biosynthesis lipoprotein
MRKYRLLPPVILVLVIVAMALARALTGKAELHSDSVLLMDTLVEVRVWGEGSVPGEAAVDSALALIARIDGVLSHGMVAGGDRETIQSHDVRRMLEASANAYALTGGLFDPTIGAVTRLWDFVDGSSPPNPDSIARALPRVGLRRFLALEDEPDSAAQFILDLGGVAKGYAVDLAAERLRGLGLKSAIVSAGGDMRLVGKRPDGKPWRIAVRHPRRPGEFIGYLNLEDVAVSTSGDYERCFFTNGTRYHHILDPATGMPGRASVAVTVVAPTATQSDVLSTGLFLAGPDAGRRMVDALPGVGAVFIWARGESIAVSDDLAGRFRPGDGLPE